MSFIEKLLEGKPLQKSSNWVMWRSKMDSKICADCKRLHGQFFSVESVGLTIICPRHPYCRCSLGKMDSIQAGYATQDGKSGADYWLVHNRRLPSNYISKEKAGELGWKNQKGNLSDVAKGKTIGGDIYQNHEGRLPQAIGRIWYEADINYISGYRGTDRIFYSSDGLIFVSYDHGATFYEILK